MIRETKNIFEVTIHINEDRNTKRGYWMGPRREINYGLVEVRRAWLSQECLR